MNDYLTLWVSVVLAAGTIIFATYLKFRNGLATRMFAMAIPLAALGAILGHYVGVQNTSTSSITVMIVIGAGVTVPWLLWLYRAIITRLDTQIATLAQSANEIAATAKQSAATAAEQAAIVAQVTATIAELQQTSAATSFAAQQVADTATDASQRGLEGLDASNRAKSVLELVSQISAIVESVREFADQSNMLAVNAGIEAAKAGEHGRGFAVVANEVRSLAEQSKLAAQRIRSAMSGAEEGRRALETANASLVRLSATLDESTDRAKQIAATVAQEAAGVRQIAEAMTSVAEGGTATAAAARQLEQAVLSMNHVTDDLRRFVAG